MASFAEAPDQATIDLADRHLALHGYRIQRLLGSGGYARVWLASSMKYNEDSVFAIKQIPVKSDSDSEEFIQELRTLQGLSHPNIILVYQGFREGDYLYIVFEYCQGGSIMDLINAQGALKPPELYHYCQRIAEALKYCHQRGVAHRDVKPANVFIDRYGRVKLADFGLSQRLRDGESSITTFSGSVVFMSPEMLQKQSYDPYRADIWALGVTFYFMATGESPWNRAKERRDIIKAIFADDIEYPLEMDGKLRFLITKMLKAKPEERISLDSLLNNAIFTPLKEMVLRRTSQPAVYNDRKLCRKKFIDKLTMDDGNYKEGSPMRPAPRAVRYVAVDAAQQNARRMCGSGIFVMGKMVSKSQIFRG